MRYGVEVAPCVEVVIHDGVRRAAECGANTTCSYQDTPGKHHALLAQSGFEVVRARGPLQEDKMLELVKEHGGFDGFLNGDDVITEAVIDAAHERFGWSAPRRRNTSVKKPRDGGLRTDAASLCRAAGRRGHPKAFADAFRIVD